MILAVILRKLVMNFKAFALIILFLSNMPLLRANIVISEFSASSSEVVFDNDFDSPDWIELFNTSDTDLNIHNYRISDHFDYNKAFVLPDTVIKAQSSIIIYASSKTAMDTSFVINSANNNYADDPKGTRYFRYIPVQGDFDIELCVRGMKDDAHKSYAGLLLTDDPVKGESISLIKYGDKYGYCEYNKINNDECIETKRTELPIPLPDFHLRMKKAGNTVNMYYAEGGSLWTEFATSDIQSSADVMYVGISVAANNYDKSASFIFKNFKLNSENIDLSQLKINYASDDLENKFFTSDEIHCDFKLSAAGESIYLWDDQSELTDSVQFGKQRSDISYGRFPETSDNWMYMTPPTAGELNNQGYKGFVPAPAFSLAAGFYNSSVAININTGDNDSEIRYTIDGSEPNGNSIIYNDETFRSDTNIVIRARAYKTGLLPSREISNSYIIDERSELPIFSISVNPDNLWNEETGIFMPQNLNFKREIPAHIDYWENKNSELIISKNLGIKLSGQVSLIFPQKSLRLLCKSKYSSGEFEHDFFGQSGYDKYDQLLLRNGGNDWEFAFIRDSYVGELIRRIPSLDVPEYRPSIAYLNGKYQGIYQLKERMNEDWLARRYDISPESINLMAEKTRLVSGCAAPFAEVFGRIVNADLDDPAELQYTRDHIDWDNIIDYTACNIFSCNYDWPWNNVRYWNSEELDGKWRWIPHDLDWTFGEYGSMAKTNSMNVVLHPDSSDFSLLFHKLSQNEDFRNKFINRTADLMNSRFQYDSLLNSLNIIVAGVDSEMARAQKKHGSNYENWNEEIDKIRYFIVDRAAEVRKHYIKKYDCGETAYINIKTNYDGACAIEINSLLLKNFPRQAVYFTDVPVRIKVLPHEGYKFIKWSDTTLPATAEVTVNLPRVYELTAIFDKTDLIDSNTNYMKFATVSPNPVSDDCLIKFYTEETTRINISVFDMSGRKVACPVEDKTYEEGSHIALFDALAYSQGSYLCVLRNVETGKVFKTITIAIKR
ncbi:MAG: CotH kinase family protein [Candidatus Kapabacteria bacterium]|jgi:hypothetical protein|nr:CotH kinase family protein [Candidatus Kapabacteria bacterium]